MLKPYPAFRFVDVAGEFPDAWEEFLDGDGAELVLPFSRRHVPRMTSRQITGDLRRFDAADAAVPSPGAQREPGLDARERQVLVTDRLSVPTRGRTGISP